MFCTISLLFELTTIGWAITNLSGHILLIRSRCSSNWGTYLLIYFSYFKGITKNEVKDTKNRVYEKRLGAPMSSCFWPLTGPSKKFTMPHLFKHCFMCFKGSLCIIIMDWVEYSRKSVCSISVFLRAILLPQEHKAGPLCYESHVIYYWPWIDLRISLLSDPRQRAMSTWESLCLPLVVRDNEWVGSALGKELWLKNHRQTLVHIIRYKFYII